MRIVIHTEAQYLPAFREVAKAVKAQVEEITEDEQVDDLDGLIVAGIIQPAQSATGKSLSDVLDQFRHFPLTYEDAKSLRRDAWKRNG